MKKIKNEVLKLLYYYRHFNLPSKKQLHQRANEIIEDYYNYGRLFKTDLQKQINNLDRKCQGINIIIRLFKSMDIIVDSNIDNIYCDRLVILIPTSFLNHKTLTLEIIQSIFEAYFLPSMKKNFTDSTDIISLFILMKFFKQLYDKLYHIDTNNNNISWSFNERKLILNLLHDNDFSKLNLDKLLQTDSINNEINSFNELVNFINANISKWNYLKKIYDSYLNIKHSLYVFYKHSETYDYNQSIFRYDMYFIKRITWNNFYLRTNFSVMIVANNEHLQWLLNKITGIHMSRGDLWECF